MKCVLSGHNFSVFFFQVSVQRSWRILFKFLIWRVLDPWYSGEIDELWDSPHRTQNYHECVITSFRSPPYCYGSTFLFVCSWERFIVLWALTQRWDEQTLHSRWSFGPELFLYIYLWERPMVSLKSRNKWLLARPFTMLNSYAMPIALHAWVQTR